MVAVAVQVNTCSELTKWHQQWINGGCVDRDGNGLLRASVYNVIASKLNDSSKEDPAEREGTLLARTLSTENKQHSLTNVMQPTYNF